MRVQLHYFGVNSNSAKLSRNRAEVGRGEAAGSFFPKFLGTMIDSVAEEEGVPVGIVPGATRDGGHHGAERGKV